MLMASAVVVPLAFVGGTHLSHGALPYFLVVLAASAAIFLFSLLASRRPPKRDPRLTSTPFVPVDAESEPAVSDKPSQGGQDALSEARAQAHGSTIGGPSHKTALSLERANGSELLQLLKNAPAGADRFTTIKQIQEWRQRVAALLRNHPATAPSADRFAVDTGNPADPGEPFLLSRVLTRAYGPQRELERRLDTLKAIIDAL